jgi:hypothetical protein
MEMQQSPPPLPGARKSRVWIVVVAVTAFVVVGLIALGVAGFVTFRRMQEKRAAQRQAMSEIEKSAAEARAKIADSVQGGDIAGGGDAIEQMKQQLEKSASQVGGGDAAAIRASATFLGKMQAQVRDYEETVKRLTTAEMFSFNVRDKAMIDEHRQIVRDFLASNARITDTVQHSEELMGAELDAAKVPARTRQETLAGYKKSQIMIRPLQLEIRRCDQALGDAALAMLDLLETNWGKWRHDAASGAKEFDDDTTLAAHNALIEKVQAAAADQAAAQEKLVKVMRQTNAR